MPPEILPTQIDDLDEVSRFLAEGFGLPGEGAPEFAAVDVLRWKYFDPTGDPEPVPRSYIARDDGDGRVVGHIGLCTATVVWPGGPPAGLPAVHGIDWLVSTHGTSLGAHLMMRVHRSAPFQYALGVSPSATRVILRAGYVAAEPIPAYSRVLKPAHWLRDRSMGIPVRSARAARDTLRMMKARERPPTVPVRLRREDVFGPGHFRPWNEELDLPALTTRRDPARLNHLLRYPRPGLSGWTIESDGRLRGVALLNVLDRGSTRVGRIVDLILDRQVPDLWHAAIVALTAELRGQGADIAETFAGAPWIGPALEASGFRVAHRVPFYLRDRGARLPAGLPWHVMPIEADYATT